MIKTLFSLLVSAFIILTTLGLPSVNAQSYTCSTLENVSEINLIKSKKSNFVIFAEDSHKDNLHNREFGLSI